MPDCLIYRQPVYVHGQRVAKTVVAAHYYTRLPEGHCEAVQVVVSPPLVRLRSSLSKLDRTCIRCTDREAYIFCHFVEGAPCLQIMNGNTLFHVPLCVI